MKEGLFILILAFYCFVCCDCLNITAGVGYARNWTVHVVNNSVSWYEAFTGCQSKGLNFLQARSPLDRKYLAFGIEKHGWQSGRFWIGSIKPGFQTNIYRAKNCSVINRDYGLPNEMKNSTQCLYVDLSGTVQFADCHLKYPFLCTSDKTIQDQEYYSTDITEINVASSLAIHEVIYNLTNEECGTSCKSLFSCVYSTYEENNCTIWKDMTYDVYVSYDLSKSSGSMTNNSIFIKTSNRVHIILIEEDTVYNNTFNCVFSFPLQNTAEQSANLTVCEFCPNAEKCNATSFAANITLEVALEVAEDLRKNLTVDKTSLSSYRRRLECADDSRPSSKVFGGFALGVLVGLVVIAIVLDCPTLTRHLRL